MYALDPQARLMLPRPRRKFPRYDIQCRARIRIGDRQYAGYLHNISQGGAKLRTVTPIRKSGNVTLRLPDLPPLRGRLRWMDAYYAGILFELALSAAELSRWARSRAGPHGPGDALEAEIVGLAELHPGMGSGRSAPEAPAAP